MKKLAIILGIILAISATVLAVLPVFKLAFIPSALALIFGTLGYFQLKKEKGSKTFVQLIFIITALALALTTYKTITVKSEVGNVKQLEKREKASEENAIEELEDIEIIE